MIERTHKGSQSRNDLNYFLTDLKESEPWLYAYHSKMLQMISTQIDGAQKATIVLNKKGHKTGTLRFARYDDYLTFSYNQSGFKIENDVLYLSKIGRIQIILHRQIPDNAQIKQVTVTKSKSGKWHACITADIDVVLPKINLRKVVGIDVGIKHFAYDSDGHVTPNPLILQKMLKPLKRIQRKVSRRQKGSQNRKKAVRFYQIMHERIKNKRKDFLHKLSAQYAKKYDMIFVEELQKQNMVKNHRLARSIMDSGWGTFSRMLDYKCNMSIKVPAKNTTAKCSRCSTLVPKSLAVRTHRCYKCNLVLDRDHNASINILKKGLEIFQIKLPQELREVTPAEISMRSRKQEKANGLVR